MRMSEKCRNNNINSDNSLTSRRTDRGKKCLRFQVVNTLGTFALENRNKLFFKRLLGNWATNRTRHVQNFFASLFLFVLFLQIYYICGT